jgi:hypothetical protein
MVSHMKMQLDLNYKDHKREDGNSLSQVQSFMFLLKENIMMSVYVMVLIWKLAHLLSFKIKHLKRGFK